MSGATLNLFPSKPMPSWPDSFDHAFECLHVSWKSNWCGLPSVLNACIQFLSFQDNELTTEVTQLLDAAREAAEVIERKIQNGSSDVEPRYHNRLHTAEALVAMTLQIAIEAELLNSRAPDWFAAALLTALIHDFQHPGRVNSKPSEIEQASITAAMPILLGSRVASEWQARIQHAVLRSDFALVEENHQRVQNLPFQWNQDWLAVLLNEADILGSSISAHGEDLGHALSEEWQLINFPPFATVATAAGRQAFLRNLQFSSNASRWLKVQAKISAQLQ